MNNRKNIILIVASTAIFFEALDIAILNLAIPLMQQSFHLGSDVMQWVQTVYVLFYGGFLVIGGKLADTIGRKKIFMGGAFLFLLTSLGAGLSRSFLLLTICRALQGLAAALVMPSAMSIITNTFTESRERNRALSLFSSFAAAGSGCGLALGGLVATWLGWQWTFFINVPVIAIALVLAYRYIDGDTYTHNKSFPDIYSGLLLTSAIVLLSYLVHGLGNAGKDYPLLLLLAVVMISLLFYFTRRERRQAIPLIDFTLFRNTSTFTGNMVTVLLGAFFLGYLFLLSLILQQNMLFSAAKAGLLLFPFSMLSFAVSRFFVPALFKKMNVLQVSILGMALMLTGALLLLAAMHCGYSLPLVLLSIACVTGSGMSVCYPSLTSLAIREIPHQQQGLAAGICTTAYFLGAGMGLSLLSLCMQLFPAAAGTVGYLPVVLLLLYAVAGICWLWLSRKRITAHPLPHIA